MTLHALSSFGPVTAEHSFQKVAAAIRQAVARGDLQPGDWLPPQHELQQVFGVSKVTILSALRVLEADGLVDVRVGRNGGALVLDAARHSLDRAIGQLLAVDQVNLAEVAEMRLSVEMQIARLAAQRATPEQLANLEALLAGLDTLAQAPDGAADASYAALDLDFHTTLAAASANRLLSACMEVLYQYLIHHSVPVSPAQQAELNRSLHALLEQGVHAGRPDLAAEAMATHLADSHRMIQAAHSSAGGTGNGGGPAAKQAASAE